MWILAPQIQKSQRLTKPVIVPLDLELWKRTSVAKCDSNLYRSVKNANAILYMVSPLMLN